MQNDLNNVYSLKNDSKAQEKAAKQFEKDHNVSPQNAPEKIKAMRGESEKIRKEIEPQKANMKELKRAQEANAKAIKNETDKLKESRTMDKREIHGYSLSRKI